MDEVKDKVRAKVRDTVRQYTFSGSRILRSYQATYFLKIEDSETIPGNVLWSFLKIQYSGFILSILFYARIIPKHISHRCHL